MKILKSQIISFAERKTLGYPFQEEKTVGNLTYSKL